MAKKAKPAKKSLRGRFSPVTEKDRAGLALLVIDVQKEFCDPKGWRGNSETRRVSQRIASLTPVFRKAGVPVYVVYTGEDPKKVGFYKFRPGRADVLIGKNTNSAFDSSGIRSILRRARRKTLLACGFNLGACFVETALDALYAGFNVCVMRDLTGNGKGWWDEHERTLAEMHRHKAVISSSRRVLREVAALQEGRQKAPASDWIAPPPSWLDREMLF